MALPRKLKHLNLFNDGNNWQGIVESLTLPKFTRKFEKYRGGGMPGAVDVDMGLDDGALDTEFFNRRYRAAVIQADGQGNR
ncbi:phage major tail tube protein FII [Salmonella enterica subsp. enterica serovar Braenderup]|nr:phage major tail tube protein FII [Salmonella enterica subsp. enterica serovar Braenderup]